VSTVLALAAFAGIVSTPLFLGYGVRLLSWDDWIEEARLCLLIVAIGAFTLQAGADLFVARRVRR
jgi:hypothetical protein